MSADSNHPQPDNSTHSRKNEHNCWFHIRAIFRCMLRTGGLFVRWLGESFREITNFPHFLVALFTLFLVIFAYYAWDESKRGTAHLQSQLDILRAEQRPWVGISGLGAHRNTPKVIAGSDFYIYVNWQNSGRLPAFNVKRTFVADLQRPVMPLQPCDTCGNGEVMLPGIPVGATPHIPADKLTPEIVNNMITGAQKIWLVGRIDYLDGDNPPKAHKTFVCYSFVADGSFIGCDIPGSNYAD